MDWDKLRIFHVVAKAGSFTEAGLTLNLAQSSVSRHITQLEESIGTTLFHRHSRGLALTAQGDYLFRTTLDMNEQIGKAQAQLLEMQNHDEGPLTITTTNFFGETWLCDAIAQFIAENPKIKINLKLCDYELDLSMREADIALRMTEPKKMDLIQRHLIRFNFHLYAHKDYLERMPKLEKLEDISKHHIICYTDNFEGPFHDSNWIIKLTGINPLSHELITKTTNLNTCVSLAEKGIGIACLPDYVAKQNNELVQILPQIERPPFNCYLCYPEELKSHQRIKTFRGFIVEKAKTTEF